MSGWLYVAIGIGIVSGILLATRQWWREFLPLQGPKTTWPPPPPLPPPPPSPPEIFVVNNQLRPTGPAEQALLARFPGNAHGEVGPTSELYGTYGAGIVINPKNGEIYVASDRAGSRVQVYRPGAMRSDPWLRNIKGGRTKLYLPAGLALDGDENLYVAERGDTSNPSALLKFRKGADGDEAPMATIPSRIPVPPGTLAALHTHLDHASGVAVDSRDGSVYVVDGTSLLKFHLDPAATGNVDVAPVVITLGLNNPWGIALGEDGSIYITNQGNASITVHDPSPMTDVAPTRTITSTDMALPYGIAVDGADRIFVTEFGSDHTVPSILVFDRGAPGIHDVTPLRKIHGEVTGLYSPMGIAVWSKLQPAAPITPSGQKR